MLLGHSRPHREVSWDLDKQGQEPNVKLAALTLSVFTETKEKEWRTQHRALVPAHPAWPRCSCSGELHHANTRLSQSLAHITHWCSQPGGHWLLRPENQGHTQCLWLLGLCLSTTDPGVSAGSWGHSAPCARDLHSLMCLGELEDIHNTPSVPSHFPPFFLPFLVQRGKKRRNKLVMGEKVESAPC